MWFNQGARLRGPILLRSHPGFASHPCCGPHPSAAAPALPRRLLQFLCTAYAGWRGAPPSPGEKGLLGGCASFATMGLTMPMENVVKRLQAQGRPGFPQRYSGGLDCAAQVGVWARGTAGRLDALQA